MNPPQSPGQPDTAQNPALITEMPRSLAPEDTSLETSVVAGYLHSNNPEQRQAAAHEMGARRETHDSFLNNQPGIKALQEESEPIAIGDHLVFAKDDDDAIISPLTFRFQDYHLPPVPNWVEPLAVVLTEHPHKKELHSVMLIARRGNAIDKMFLEDPNLRADSTECKSGWLVPGMARLSSESYEVKKTDENDEVLTVELGWTDFKDDTAPENIRIVRGEPSETEKAFMDVEAPEKQRRIFAAIGKIAGVVGMAAILSNMAPSSADQMPEKTVLEAELQNPSRQEAAKRVQENIEAYKAGDLEALQRNFANTEFAKPVIDQATLEKVDNAKSLDEITAIIDGEFEQYGIDFRILRDNVESGYNGMSDEHLGAAKETALGILDGANNLRAIGVGGEDYDIEVANEVFVTRDGVTELAGGIYKPSWQGSKPVIRIGATSRPLAARTMEHENGHSYLKSLEPHIEKLNPDDAEYRRDDRGKLISPGNLVAGRNVASNYGGEDPGEDAAELLETAVGQNIGIDLTKENILQQKYLEMIIDIEDREPGAGAFILHNALTHQMLAEDKLESTVLGALDLVRSNASHALLLAGLTLAVGGGLARENRALIDRQIKAGLRPRRIYKQSRRSS